MSKLFSLIRQMISLVVFAVLLLGGAKLTVQAVGHPWLQALCMLPSVFLLQWYDGRPAQSWRTGVVTALVTYVFLLAFFFVAGDLSHKGLHAVMFVFYAKFAPVARVVKWLEGRWRKVDDGKTEAA